MTELQKIDKIIVPKGNHIYGIIAGSDNFFHENPFVRHRRLQYIGGLYFKGATWTPQ